jgi:hypothetical protein
MSKEALKLALEALKLNNDEWKSLADSGDCGYWNAEDQDHYKQTNEAITVCEQALAAHTVQEPQRYSPDGEGGMEVDSLGAYVKHQDVTTPAAPTVQEPVGEVKDLFTQAAWEKLDVRGSTKVYLGTPPAAQRTWTGLTDDERSECVNTPFVSQQWANIEAKLKEKNGV